MFMTSVGVPSVIYETVKNLRQARGHRLGACQRKFPRLGIWLLYILALLELAAFPLLGAGTVAGQFSSVQFVYSQPIRIEAVRGQDPNLAFAVN